MDLAVGMIVLVYNHAVCCSELSGSQTFVDMCGRFCLSTVSNNIINNVKWCSGVARYIINVNRWILP